MQVRAVCYELGISERETFLLRQIDRATERGEKGIETFAVLDDVDDATREAGLQRLFAKYDAFVKNLEDRAESGDSIAREVLLDSNPAQQRGDMEKMYIDPDFRRDMWGIYSERILPKLQEMGDDPGYFAAVTHMVETEFAEDGLSANQMKRLNRLVGRIVTKMAPAGYIALEREYTGQPRSEES